MDEAVLGAEEVDEGAEVDDLHHGALVDLADLGLGGDRLDPVQRGGDRLAVGRGDLDRAVVVDVDLGAGLLDDLADDLAAGADDFADLVGRDLDHLDARRVFAELGAGLGQRLGHLAEDVQPAVLGLVEGDPHDLLGDALDLDVHLQRGDAVLRAGDLEVHVAEMVLVAEDVGEHGEAAVLSLIRPMAMPATGCLSGTPASISASEVPQTVAIEDEPFELGDLGDDAERVGEVMVRREASDGRRARRACRGRSRGGRGSPCGRSRPPSRAGNCSAA